MTFRHSNEEPASNILVALLHALNSFGSETATGWLPHAAALLGRFHRCRNNQAATGLACVPV